MSAVSLSRIPPRTRALVLGLAAARVLFHLLTHRGYGVFRDELYYLACAEHLDFGYVDHPPLAPALAWLVRHTLGDSLFAVRLLPALAGGATVAFAGFACHALGGGQLALWLACLGTLFSPVLLAFGHTFSMNVFEPLFWASATWLLVRMAQGASAREWLWFGLIAGLGLENKHSMLFLGFGALVATLGTPVLRDTLRTRWPWLALAVALLLFAPNLLWQVQHGFPTLEFMHNARTYKNLALAPGEFVAQQLLQQDPFAAPLWLGGLWWSLSPAGRARGAGAIGLVYLTVLAVFVATSAKPYYLAPAYPLLFAAGGVAVERLGAALARTLACLVAAGGLVGLPMVVPVLSEPDYVRYAAALHVQPDSGERKELGVLPQFFADMHGWPELARDVARVWSQLPQHEQRTCAIYANNYGEAGAIDYFGPALGLPRAIAGHNSYWLWGPRGTTGECILVIGGDRDDHLKAYRSVEAVGESRGPYRMPYENVTLWMLRGPRLPVRALWPRVKNYI